METKLSVSLTNINELKSAVKKTENKLAELKKAISELEKIDFEVQVE